MKFAVALALALASTFAVASHGKVCHHHRQQCSTNNMPMGSNPSSNTAGWVQKPKGQASFTVYGGCGNPSCGGSVNGYSAAVNTLAFGADVSFGDACGRCFQINATEDPYSPQSYKGPFNSIVVKVNDLCPHSPQGTKKSWCDQKVSDPLNQFKMPMHFDLCEESGAPSAFMPAGRGAMIGTYEEVSCDKWIGNKCPVPRWDNWCMAESGSALWPKQACGNTAIPSTLE